MRRDRRPGACVLLLTVCAALALPGRAVAGGTLTGSDPADGAALEQAPATVTLRFSGPVDLASAHVSVFAQDGTDRAGGDTRQPSPDALEQPTRDIGSGDLTVAYHVVLNDGTEVTGAFRFSVGTGAPPPPLDSGARSAATSAVTAHRHGVDPLSAVLLVIDGAVLAAVLLLLGLRPRDRQPMTLRATRGDP